MLVNNNCPKRQCWAKAVSSRFLLHLITSSHFSLTGNFPNNSIFISGNPKVGESSPTTKKKWGFYSSTDVARFHRKFQSLCCSGGRYRVLFPKGTELRQGHRTSHPEHILLWYVCQGKSSFSSSLRNKPGQGLSPTCPS